VADWALRTDGGSRGNPGPAGCGFVLERGDGDIACRGGRFLGVKTNNEAEYEALLWGLECATAFPEARRVTVFADSELLVKQMNRVYRVKHPNLRPLFERAVGLTARFDSVKFVHVYREANKLADALANEAMDLRATVGDAPCGLDDGQGTLFE
jgi:ribonuclease HI